jgi:CHASE3 domain sensor protein
VDFVAGDCFKSEGVVADSGRKGNASTVPLARYRLHFLPEPPEDISLRPISGKLRRGQQSDTNLALLRSSCVITRKEGAINMIRKIGLRLFAATLIALTALNAYLAINRLRLIQKSDALTLESSTIHAKISGALQDLTDMETGQRGYLLTEDPAYLLPYTEGTNRIGTDFASLRAGLANRTERERSLESQLESLAGSKQAEMERTITLRQQGYRHRAFTLVDTNEGRDYMDGARRLVSSLSSAESGSFARFDEERTASLKKAFSETIIANSCLLVLTVCLFGFIRYYGRVLEQEAAESRQALAMRDSQLEKLTSALSNKARSKMTAIEENTRLLLEEYGGFLPRHGHECAEKIKEAAAQMERLRRELLGQPSFDQTDQEAA